MIRGLLLLGVLVGPAAGQNLLRNGSFEGGLLYWHNVNPDQHRLVGESTVGRWGLRLDDGYVMSAPFVAERGRPITVSFDVKGDAPGEVQVQIPPSAREDGQRAGRLWTAEARRTAPIDSTWRRVSITMPADVPASGFWPKPHYMVLIEASVGCVVDGVTVQIAEAGTPRFVPARPVEVIVDCPDLPGYAGEGNFLRRGQTARLTAWAANAADLPREVTLRWQLIDYEGTRPVAEPIERAVTIPAGGTVRETAALALNHAGCVLARVSVLAGGLVIDSADLPLTTLAYPRFARAPDPRERFGGSFFGPASARLGSRLGFAWSRWYPHTKWQDHQPDGPDDQRWFDHSLGVLEGLGISAHLVLYGWPKWIMDEGGDPRPRDMRWPADDPRWDDLTIETAWDRYLTRVAEHYRGRAVVYEIENEPEFDRWDNLRDEYARFTIRSARRLKAADPTARVMVNNVYAIPSGLNRRLLELGGGAVIDIVSWHDYHEGWLTDYQAIRRMRAELDALGAAHAEIWFNEGWAYCNTAVDEPLACGTLTAADSTNALVGSVAQMSVAGQQKTILFHTGYEQHGMSFWDYSGPGTMLWDWYGHPLPLAAAWNVLCWHLGLSEEVGFVRPPGAALCVFHDRRNDRGVIVAQADRGAADAAVVVLPDLDWIAEDAMGNATPLGGRTLTLAANGRPAYLYTTDGRRGAELLAALDPLDRRHTGFVAADGSLYRLPGAWEGVTAGSAEGNPATADGQPVWRLDQIWPPDPTRAAGYRPLVWGNGRWEPIADAFGGQPKAERLEQGLRLEFRAAHGEPAAARLAGLIFRAPRAGEYQLGGVVDLRLWDGRIEVALRLLHKGPNGIAELAAVPLSPDQPTPLAQTVSLAAGDELVLLPSPAGAFVGGEVLLRDLEVRRQP